MLDLEGLKDRNISTYESNLRKREAHTRHIGLILILICLYRIEFCSQFVFLSVQAQVRFITCVRGPVGSSK